MQPVSNGLGRTIVVVVSTLLCGSTLMFAAIGPGMAQASTAQHAVAAAQWA